MRSHPTRCSFCGSTEHPVALCDETSRGQQNRRALRCLNCESDQHELAWCPRTPGGIAARRLTPDGMFLD